MGNIYFIYFFFNHSEYGNMDMVKYSRGHAFLWRKISAPKTKVRKKIRSQQTKRNNGRKKRYKIFKGLGCVFAEWLEKKIWRRG
jgi:hypothetical protein